MDGGVCSRASKCEVRSVSRYTRTHTCIHVHARARMRMCVHMYKYIYIYIKFFPIRVAHNRPLCAIRVHTSTRTMEGDGRSEVLRPRDETSGRVYIRGVNERRRKTRRTRQS
jgi:hypothetical protein